MLRVTMQNLERLSLAEMKEFVERSRKVRLSTETREDLWLGAGHAAQSAVSEVEQRTKRYCEPIPGEGDRSQPGADDAPGGVLDEAAVHPTEDGGEEAAIRAALSGSDDADTMSAAADLARAYLSPGKIHRGRAARARGFSVQSKRVAGRLAALPR
jgi:hypothetical protein